MIINLAKIRFGGSGGGTSPAKPEDFFQETYTANGNYDVAPQAGHVFSGGQIEVNVQPRLQTKEATPLTLTQTVSPDAGYDGLQSVTVTGVTSEIDSNITADNIKKDVTILGVTGTLESGITPEGTITITANGTYDVSSKATADVQVGGTDYRYKTGTPDTIGLAAIGWTADDIGYYGANAPHYAWENDNYKVSQKNIDLYNLDDPKPDLYKFDPEVTFVPNKNILTYFGPTSGFRRFEDMKYIKSIPWYDTSSRTSMNKMFENCANLETIPPLDTSNVTIMEAVFRNCTSLQSIPLLNTSNVTDMIEMFCDCSSLQTIPVLDTSNVTYMRGLFKNCSRLTSIPLLNTSNVTQMVEMFNGCSSLQTIPLLDTSNVTDISYMFYDCSSLQTIPLLNTSNVTNMSGVFHNCSKLTSIPLLNTSNVTSMSGMFEGCSALTSVSLTDVSNVTSMYKMFGDCSYGLDTVSLTGTSNVTNMEEMFYRCSFLTSVSLTGTSKASRMNYMFYDCERLEGIEGIDFSSMTSKPTSFFGYSSLNRLTHFIVNGKINFSWNDNYGFYNAPNLDYDSIKSILEAMNRTDNTNAKTMKFNQAIIDRDGELAGLVSSCTTKGWTIQGLTVKEKSMINSITPSLDHIHIRDLRGGGPGLTLTIDANEAWIGGGIPKKHTTTGSYIGYQYDFYDANTDELTRTGSSYQNIAGMWVPDKGSIGITNITGHYDESSLPAPQSGEYALVGISLRTDSTAPYEYVDYYFKVYPNGE